MTRIKQLHFKDAFLDGYERNTLLCGTYRDHFHKAAKIENIVFADKDTLIQHGRSGFQLSLNTIINPSEYIRLTFGKYNDLQCGDLLVFQGTIDKCVQKGEQSIMLIKDFPILHGIIRAKRDKDGNVGFTLYKPVDQICKLHVPSTIEGWSDDIYKLFFNFVRDTPVVKHESRKFFGI